jgi:uncharacterized protein (TIGR02996 family)
MTERASFLLAIRAAPDDLPLRLVFADWLEERGDPLAEFIRVQCELEPIRDDYRDPRTERLHRREEELLREHRAAWLSEAAFLHDLDWPYGEAFTFWRGLPDEVALPVRLFVEHGALLPAACPTLRKAVAFEVNGDGRRLAECEALSHFQALEIADWISPADARSLADSPHLRELRTLTVWLGNRNQKRVCRALAAGLPGLRRMELVQHSGEKKDSARADALAAVVNELRGAGVASVRRPFERLFPLRDEVYSRLYAGRLPGDRQALAACGSETMMLVLFDAAGNHVGEEFRSREQGPASESAADWQDLDESELLPYLKSEFDFEPGWIRVKECHVDRYADFGWYFGVYLYNGTESQFIEDPDVTPRHSLENERREIGARVYRWLKRGDFVVWMGGDEIWAGPRGYVHST